MFRISTLMEMVRKGKKFLFWLHYLYSVTSPSCGTVKLFVLTIFTLLSQTRNIWTTATTDKRSHASIKFSKRNLATACTLPCDLPTTTPNISPKRIPETILKQTKTGTRMHADITVKKKYWSCEIKIDPKLIVLKHRRKFERKIIMQKRQIFNSATLV